MSGRGNNTVPMPDNNRPVAYPPRIDYMPGRRWLGFAICFAVGGLLWSMAPPAGVDIRGWHLLAVFAATIIGFVIRPASMGTVVIIAMVVLALTETLVDPVALQREYGDAWRSKSSKLSLAAVLSGYSNPICWLVVAAFLISGAVIRTGLGRRISLLLIRKLGRSTVGIAWGIACAELVLGPFVPSNTARGGGVLAPIVDALCRTLEGEEKSKHRGVSQFLILCGAHSNLITAAMFLTGMAGNAILYGVAKEAGVNFNWGVWALGSVVPGLVALFLLPVLLARVVRPEAIDIAAACREAERKIQELGSMTGKEKILVGVLLLMLGLWATHGHFHHIYTTTVALTGVALLLVTKVERWRDMAHNYGAWDALIWLGGLVMMAGFLRELGIVAWFAGNAQNWVSGMGGVVVAIALVLIYFFSMYGFSMLTGHISAMAGAFLAVAIGAGTEPILMVALLAYFSNLCGCLTNYSTGPVVIYFGLGYVSPAKWFQVGFLMALYHLVIWLGLGMLWWKILGWW